MRSVATHSCLATSRCLGFVSVCMQDAMVQSPVPPAPPFSDGHEQDVTVKNTRRALATLQVQPIAELQAALLGRTLLLSADLNEQL